MIDPRPCLLRLPLTALQFADAEHSLDVMSDFAESEDSDCTPDDLPWLDHDERTIRFPFQADEPHHGVVDDLIYRLEQSQVDGSNEGSHLARLLRQVFHKPDGQMRQETRLRGAYAHLIRQGVFKGVDFNVLAARLWQLPAMRAEGPLPKVRWRALSKGTWASGVAHVGRESVTVRIGTDCSIEYAAEVLLHELVHMACPIRESHGELFRRRLIACAREAFGLALDTAALMALGPGKRGKRAYAIDDAIIATMVAADVGDKLRQDAPFTAPPPETPEQVEGRRAAVTSARVAANESHARAMLAQWDTRIKRARTLRAKWARRVQYYDRRQAAAKRGT